MTATSHNSYTTCYQINQLKNSSQSTSPSSTNDSRRYRYSAHQRLCDNALYKFTLPLSLPLPRNLKVKCAGLSVGGVGGRPASGVGKEWRTPTARWRVHACTSGSHSLPVTFTSLHPDSPLLPLVILWLAAHTQSKCVCCSNWFCQWHMTHSTVCRNDLITNYHPQHYWCKTIQKTYLLFGLKVNFSRILDSLYGAFWQCSRFRL